MPRLSSRRVAVALSAGATVLAVGAAALPAQAAAIPGWRINTTLQARNRIAEFLSVDAVSARDAWSAGITAIRNGASFQGLIRHWNGKSWTAVALPAKVAAAWNKAEPADAQVGASSPSNVWILGGTVSPVYLRLNGTRWSVGHLPGPSASSGKLLEVNAIRVFSKSNVWAFGGIDNYAAAQPTVAPYAAHFNGRRWSVTAVPGDSAITAASAASSGSIWAVAGTGEGITAVAGGPVGKQLVLHWGPKGGWQEVAQPVLPAGGELAGVTLEAGHVVVAGTVPNGRKGRSPLLVTWNGKAWSAPSVAGASPTKWSIAGLAADGRGGIWVTGLRESGNPGKLWHVVAGKWAAVQPAFGKHAWFLAQIATVPHTDSVWGAGALKAGKSAVGLMALAGPTPR
jgi:hypothetical protein